MASSDATPPPAPSHRGVRRAGAALITTLVALGGVVLMVLFFQGRDSSQLDSAPTAAGPGQALADSGRSLAAGGVTRFDGVRLDGAQLVDTLRRGNVVLLYDATFAPAALRALARNLSGPFDPALVASGQAVVLARRAGTEGVVALAWQRVLRTPDPADPALEAFASHWLGRGAP